MDEKPTIVSVMEDEDLREIRMSMDHTKRDLAATMDDLRERYSPDRMKQSARDTADDLEGMASEMLQKRKEDLRRVAERIGETIRNHAAPFTAAGIAGLGISAWALLRSRAGDEGEGEVYPPEGFQGIEDQRAVAGYYTEHGENMEFLCEEEGEEGEGRVSRMAEQIGEKARMFRETASSGSDRLRENFVQVVREHPFLTGTATFLLGVLTGLVFPSTKPEDEVLGGARRKVREKAQEIRDEAKESAQRIAEEARRAAAEEAEKHGLSR